MAIYTKTGDTGTTALFDGTRVPKNSLRVDTYGTFDELNAQVSVCEKLVVSPDNKHVLHTLQHQLFRLCAEVARGERLLISLGSVEPIRDEVRKFINRLSDALYIMARMEDYVQFVETIVERVSERVTTSREEILTGSNQCVGNIEQTAENGVNDMTTGTELEHIMTKLSQAAMDYAQSIGVPIVVSIVDANGVLMYFQRMSDALLISNDIAQAKAYRLSDYHRRRNCRWFRH